MTGLPVDCVAVPEGGALGAAYLARASAGLEPDSSDAGRWAATDRRVDPDPVWHGAAGDRYARFVERDRRAVHGRWVRRGSCGGGHRGARDGDALVDAANDGMLPEPEPADVRFTVISVDDHLVEPPHLFEGRMPSHLADRAPYVRTTSKGHEIWVFDGQAYPQVGLNAVAGRSKRRLADGAGAVRPDAPGCWDPDARVADMDLGGHLGVGQLPVARSPGSAGRSTRGCSDPELGLACVRAWNDWFVEEWCAPHPERFVPVGITFLADPELAAAEIRRNAERGVPGGVAARAAPAARLPDRCTRAGGTRSSQACVETGHRRLPARRLSRG